MLFEHGPRPRPRPRSWSSSTPSACPRVFIRLSAVRRDRGAAVAGRCAIGCTPFIASPRRRAGLPTRPRSDVPVGSGQPVGNASHQEDPQHWPQWTDTVRPVGGRSAMIRTGRRVSALVSAHRHGPPPEQHVNTEHLRSTSLPLYGRSRHILGNNQGRDRRFGCHRVRDR